MVRLKEKLDRLWNPNQPLRVFPQPFEPALNPFIKDGLRIFDVMACELPPQQNIKLLSVLGMLMDAHSREKLVDVVELIEATSGNTGLALVALALCYSIFRITLVVQPDLAVGKRDPLELSGATLIPADEGYTAIETAQNRGGIYSEDDTWKAVDGVLNLGQYHNLHNPDLHELYTGPKIYEGLPDISLCVGGIGTGGTMIGVMNYLRTRIENVKGVGVLCAPGQKVPGVRDRERMKEVRLPWERAIDASVEVDTRAAYLTTLWLLRATGSMCGPSGGFAHFGLLKFFKSCKETGKPYDLDQLRIKKGRNEGLIHAAVMIPDTYRPYIDHFKANLPNDYFRLLVSPAQLLG